MITEEDNRQNRQNLPDLPNLINLTIEKQEHEPERKYIGASSIADPCARKLWYGYHGIIGNKIPSKTKITFQIGHKLEDMIMDYLKESGIIIINRNKFYEDSEIHQFQGHVDGIIVLSHDEKLILELKTANDASFNKFKKHGLKSWSTHYNAQLQSYMGMSGIHQSVLLAINKNTSELHAEYCYFDPIIYEELKAKASYIINQEDPPERISTNKMYYLCSQCKYKDICYE